MSEEPTPDLIYLKTISYTNNQGTDFTSKVYVRASTNQFTLQHTPPEVEDRDFKLFQPEADWISADTMLELNALAIKKVKVQGARRKSLGLKGFFLDGYSNDRRGDLIVLIGINGTTGRALAKKDADGVKITGNELRRNPSFLPAVNETQFTSISEEIKTVQDKMDKLQEIIDELKVKQKMLSISISEGYSYGFDLESAFKREQEIVTFVKEAEVQAAEWERIRD